jgi:protein-S-isoprenylcysteine O-methyltransferase Ste14
VKHRGHFLELRIPPLALLAMTAAAMAAVARAVPFAIPVPARLSIATALVLAGVAFALLGVVTFRRQKTTVNPLPSARPSSLVTLGVYGYSRNPMYLGFLLVLLGWCVYLANPIAALLLPAFVAYVNRFQIRPEESVLAERFGQQFREYCGSVRRWI